MKRYKGSTHILGKVEETERKRYQCLELEKQLIPHLKIHPEQITNTSIKSYLTSLQEYDI